MEKKLENQRNKEVSIPLFKGYENPDKPIIALWLDYRLRIEMLENIHHVELQGQRNHYARGSTGNNDWVAEASRTGG